MKREFTGRDMFLVLFLGFGIVFAVNFYMAARATSGFGGVVVGNSYVASQKFNRWLDEAEKVEKLGWSAKLERDPSGKLAVNTTGVPEGARVSAELRRPLGEREILSLAFTDVNDARFVSVQPVDPGRWIVRLRIESAGEVWTREERL